jgi:predicted nucleic acid-binding protein
MRADVFVDTNVLLYARDASEREKQPRARAWVDALWEQRRARLSFQVLDEYYVSATRKLSPGLAPEEARADVRDLMAWRPVAVDVALIEDAWRIEDRFGLHFWDAQIVAAARAAACRYLLTEDLQAGQDLDGIRVVDPFSTLPQELPSGA